jgi:hypothetical protein
LRGEIRSNEKRSRRIENLVDGEEDEDAAQKREEEREAG